MKLLAPRRERRRLVEPTEGEAYLRALEMQYLGTATRAVLAE